MSLSRQAWFAPGRKFLRAYAQQPAAVVAALIVALVAILGLLAPSLPLSDPVAFAHRQYAAPEYPEVMGTDNMGRSVLSRTLHGIRVGLTVGLMAAGLATLFGIAVGALAGYFGGWIDALLSRAIDIFLLIPTFFLALLIIALFGPSVGFIVVVIAITMWPKPARIMRAQVLTLRERTFVQAARVSGAGHLGLLFGHIVPNGIAPVITQGSILIGSAILVEAGLSFLGMGDPNVVSWGRLIQEGQAHLRIAPWMSFFPGALMLLTVTAINLMGDGLNHAIAPQAATTPTPRPRLRVRSEAARAPSPAEATSPTALLSVRDLRMHYLVAAGEVRSVDGVSFDLRRGESLGLVGESGCGKTSIGLTLMRVLPKNAEVSAGEVYLDGREVLKIPDREFASIRWNRIAMVFQSAMNALNPVVPVGEQLVAIYRLHRREASRADAKRRVLELFDVVGIARNRARAYPHELSGGMRQRVMIAMALLLDPEVIIADEPTTALDVVVQDQILSELARLRRDLNLAMILISHDMGIVAESCDKVAVMYGGRIIEEAPAPAIFRHAHHPYTRGLFDSLPTLQGPRRELIALPGESTAIVGEVAGCRFAPRCPLADDTCRSLEPPRVRVSEDHLSLCHHAHHGEMERVWRAREVRA
jgi:peptide/nickel transport system permease protein